MKRLIIILIAFELALVQVFPQVVKPGAMLIPSNIHSPNANELGKFGGVSCNLNSGTPNINIPLVETISGDIGVDVSMSYDASGMRTNQHPTWVGQNWLLSAGGVITRIVNGYEDEFDYGINDYYSYNGNYHYKLGYFYTKCQSYYYDKNTACGINPNTIPPSGILYEYDCQPDIFSFNFMGKTGRFLMDNSGNWKVQSDFNIEVIFNTDNQFYHSANSVFSYFNSHTIFNSRCQNNYKLFSSIQGFKLRDDQGNTYIFGLEDNAVEYSIDFFNQLSSNKYDLAHWVSNAWYLTKVIDKNNKVLYEFDYVRGKFIAEFHNSVSYKKIDVNRAEMSDGMVVDSHYQPTPDEKKVKLVGSLISPVYLSSIDIVPSNQSVHFYSSESNERPYTNFRYEISSGGLTPAFGQSAIDYINIDANKFPYNTFTSGDYFNKSEYSQTLYPYLQLSSPNNENPFIGQNDLRATEPIRSLRWQRLDKIVFSQGMQTIKTIAFVYNNGQQGEGDRLFPTKLNFVYYKNLNGSIQADSVYSYSFEYYGDYQNLPKYLSNQVDRYGYTNSTNGMLKKIIYPTKGSTQFEYEHNKASHIVNGVSLEVVDNTIDVSGFRIKSIIERNGNDEDDIEKRYYYENDNKSGIRLSKIGFESTVYELDSHIKLTYYMDNPQISMTNFSGQFIEYPYVKEMAYNHDSLLIERNEYRYSSYSDLMDENPIEFFSYGDPNVRFTDKSFMRGKILEITNQDMLKKRITKRKYTYRSGDEQSVINSKILASTFGYDYYSFIYTYYDPYAYYPEDMFEDRVCFVDFPTGSRYSIYYPTCDIISEQTSVYDLNMNVIYTSIKKYNKSDYIIDSFLDYQIGNNGTTRSKTNVRLTNSVETLTSDGNYYKEQFYYPNDNTVSFLTSDTVRHSLVYLFRWQPLSVVNSKGGDILNKEECKYDKFNNLIQPSAVYKSNNYETVFNLTRPELTFDSYDSNGYLQTYTNKDGISNTIIWDKLYLKPAVLINNMKYSNLVNILGGNPEETFAYESGRTSTSGIQAFETIRSANKYSYLYLYDYGTLGQLKREIKPDKSGSIFEYDHLDRLSRVKLLNGKILESFRYNYRDDYYSTSNSPY